ncbi:MAG: RNA 2',3'-cyclic phosphodiesterase [Rhodospirillaceae bacterium]|nr:RNA 2',3'-cyclic phosphodiesterase [Rhodospirillaceae bacterium]
MRLFVGLDLPEDLRLTLGMLRDGINGARWVTPANFHITLRFIGECDRHQAADLDDALADIEAPAFDLAFDGVGSFASRGRLRAVWAGLESSGALQHLHDKVERATVRAGFAEEQRKFKPHVTLSRFKGTPEFAAQRFLEDHAGFTTQPFTVDRFVLFESTLGGEGAHYTPVAKYPLGTFDYDEDFFGDLAADYPEYADQDA